MDIESAPLNHEEDRRAKKGDEPLADEPTVTAGRFELCLGQERDVALESLPGIGARRAEILRERGIVDQRELLLFFPRRYRRVYRFVPGPQIVEAQCEFAEFYARIVRVKKPSRYSRAPLSVTVDCDGATFELLWFNMQNARFVHRFEVGRWLRVSGQIDHSQRPPKLSHPSFEILGGEPPEAVEPSVGFDPVYSAIEGVPETSLRRAIEACGTQLLPHVVDVVPRQLLVTRGLPTVREAIATLHLLESAAPGEGFEQALERARDRLIYEEFYTLQHHLAGVYVAQRQAARAPRCTERGLGRRLVSGLPFELTGDQKEALARIAEELGSRRPMRRLLQGDVGSGKTVVAFAAAALAIGNGQQVALMAPTDVLARQHHARAATFFDGLDVRIGLLTGATQGARREQLLRCVRDGQIDLLIGTHALFQDDVVYASESTAQDELVGRAAMRGFGLVIVDEQHKFGVEQRQRLLTRGRDPHLLAMTATPIPRSLAHALFGDLDLTVIREKPPGRKPVRTFLRHRNAAPRVYRYVRERVEKAGQQAFVVFPAIETTIEGGRRPGVVEGAEKLANGPLAGLRVGILHGRMSSDDKRTIMERFAGGEIDVLCATTVIEVGVDVANATLMVIEGAEMFGLSQLHQLRGRVGRGEAESMCILLAGDDLTDAAEQRLDALCQTEDGFRLAELDLCIRGPGQFLGERQAGLPEFRFGDLVADAPLLEQAREDARQAVFGAVATRRKSPKS